MLVQYRACILSINLQYIFISIVCDKVQFTAFPIISTECQQWLPPLTASGTYGDTSASLYGKILKHFNVPSPLPGSNTYNDSESILHSENIIHQAPILKRCQRRFRDLRDDTLCRCLNSSQRSEGTTQRNIPKDFNLQSEQGVRHISQ